MLHADSTYIQYNCMFCFGTLHVANRAIFKHVFALCIFRDARDLHKTEFTVKQILHQTTVWFCKGASWQIFICHVVSKFTIFCLLSDHQLQDPQIFVFVDRWSHAPIHSRFRMIWFLD